MTDRKYVVIPGKVRSRTDGDMHYIGARRLMELYDVHPDECYVVKREEDRFGLPKDLIFLEPRFNGNYRKPK